MRTKHSDRYLSLLCILFVHGVQGSVISWVIKFYYHWYPYSLQYVTSYIKLTSHFHIPCWTLGYLRNRLQLKVIPIVWSWKVRLYHYDFENLINLYLNFKVLPMNLRFDQVWLFCLNSQQIQCSDCKNAELTPFYLQWRIKQANATTNIQTLNSENFPTHTHTENVGTSLDQVISNKF